jgi:hypothetical protein
MAARSHVEQLRAVGPLYGALNQVAPVLRLMACGSWMLNRLPRPELVYIVSSVVTSLLLPFFNYVSGALAGAAAPTNTIDPKIIPSATASATPRVLVVLALDRAACVMLILVLWEYSTLSLIHSSSWKSDAAIGVATAAAMAVLWLACPKVLGLHPTSTLMMSHGIDELAPETEDEAVARMNPAHRSIFLALKFLKVLTRSRIRT